MCGVAAMAKFGSWSGNLVRVIAQSGEMIAAKLGSGRYVPRRTCWVRPQRGAFWAPFCFPPQDEQTISFDGDCIGVGHNPKIASIFPSLPFPVRDIQREGVVFDLRGCNHGEVRQLVGKVVAQRGKARAPLCMTREGVMPRGTGKTRMR